MPQRTNFYSDEAQSILGRAPSWVVRWGITVVFLIFVGIIVGCYFIKYPDTIEAPAVITTVNPPSDLVARYDGLIDTLCVKDKELVERGELIAVLHNAAERRDVERLSEHLLAADTLAPAALSQPVRGSTENMRSGSCNPPSLTSKAAAATTATTLRRTISPAKKSFCANRSPRTASITPNSNGNVRCCCRISTTAAARWSGIRCFWPKP